MSNKVTEVNSQLKSFFENNFNESTFFDEDSFTISKGSTQVMVKANNITDDHVGVSLVVV